MDGRRHVGAFLGANPLAAFDGEVTGQRQPPGTEDDEEAGDDDGGGGHALQGGAGRVPGGHQAPQPGRHQDDSHHDPTDEDPARLPVGHPEHRRLLDDLAEKGPLVRAGVAPHQHHAGDTEGHRPDESGGEAQPESPEGQEETTEDGGEGQAQGDGPAVGWWPAGRWT